MWRATLCIIACLVLPAISQAQQSGETAPVPSQILNAKRIFIANAPPGGIQPIDSRIFSGGPYRSYDQFYSAMKAWRHYVLVASPADADLVLEISCDGNQVIGAQFRVLVVDPKSQVPLWWITEPLRSAMHRKASDKFFEEAMAKLVQDVKRLAAVESTSANSQSTSTLPHP